MARGASRNFSLVAVIDPSMVEEQHLALIDRFETFGFRFGRVFGHSSVQSSSSQRSLDSPIAPKVRW